MIYSQPSELSPVDQGDIIDDCPVAIFEALPDPRSKTAEFTSQLRRVYVLTQACDLAQRKAASVVVAVVIDADQLVASGQLKAADVRGPIRAGRVHGWYFLPRSPALGLPESIVDFRTLHTVRLDVLEELCRAGKRMAHLESLYREHLAQHFAHTYSRIGLPAPYETL
ncbi:MAG: hypothetical protein MUF06_19900 [Pirellulaceae bacterium]|nr:hypothetical protein [Pirellulaceae bacterium]